MLALDAVAQRYRDEFLNTVSSMTPVREPAIYLSGGADSMTILAALLALGKNPFVVSFRIDDFEPTDLRVVRDVCDVFDLRLHVSTIRRDNLLRDVRTILGMLRTPRKTAVQCAHPIMHMAFDLRTRGHYAAWMGTGGIIEDNRSGAILLHDQGEDAFREYRRANLASGTGANGDNGTWAMHRISRHFGVDVLEPYSAEPFASYALSLDAAEINRPFQKGIAFRAFPEFWKRGAWRRTNSSLQSGTGIVGLHDTLLRSELNVNGRKAMVAFYRDLLDAMDREQEQYEDEHRAS